MTIHRLGPRQRTLAQQMLDGARLYRIVQGFYLEHRGKRTRVDRERVMGMYVRGLVFEFLGLTALGAYLTLYQGYVARRSEALGRSTLTSPVGHPA